MTQIRNLEEMPQALNYLISKVESLEEMVNELNIKKDVPVQPEWMDIDELRQYLPSHPAKQTIYGWVNDKLIPYYKASKKLTFKKSEIDEWLHQGRRKSSEDLMREAGEFISQKKAKKWTIKN